MKKVLYVIVVFTFLSSTGYATDLKFKNLLNKSNTKMILNGLFMERKLPADDFEKGAAGLGYAIHYKEMKKDGCLMSFYIYDNNPVEIKINDTLQSIDINIHNNGKAPIQLENTPIETLNAYTDIFTLNRDLTPPPPTPETGLAYAQLFHKIKLEYKEQGKSFEVPPTWVLVGKKQHKIMGVGVTNYENNFLKARLTCSSKYTAEEVQHTVEKGVEWLYNELDRLRNSK